MKNVVSVKQIF